MKDCKKIKLIFENTESIDITKAVGDFNMEGLSSEISRVAINSIAKSNLVKHVAIQIYYDGEFSGNIYDDCSYFDRISKYNDIIGIELTYTDNTSETFYPPFSDEYENKWQTSKIINNDLYLVIDKEKTVDDIYGKETIAELEGAKEMFLQLDVIAKNNLIKYGWNITWQDDVTFQITKNNIVITMSKNTFKVLDLVTKHEVEFTSCQIHNIFNFIFFVMKCHYTYDSDEYTWICLGDMNIKKQENGDEIIEVPFIVPIEGLIRYLKTKDAENKFELYTGELELDDIHISCDDLLDLMWIHNEMLDDNFWSRYK